MYLKKGLKADLVICAGWSWIIPATVLKECLVIGIHPSDLPQFAGGSPIQHQIEAGLERSNNSLFVLTDQVDAGPVIAKTPFELHGEMTDIFFELTRSSLVLLDSFLNEYPQWPMPPSKNVPQTRLIRRRLTKDDGELSKEKFLQFKVRDLYNFLRCREAPYPNAFLRDATGTLYFEKVRFEPNA